MRKALLVPIVALAAFGLSGCGKKAPNEALEANGLDKHDLADGMLRQIRAAARTVTQQADVLVAEADLVARLGIPSIVPVHKPYDGGTFLVNPLVAAQLDANQEAVGSWRRVKTVSPAKATAIRSQRRKKGE